MSTASISLIIPNWNGLHHLQTCLDAVFEQTWPHYEVVLVDNGSSDGSCQFVADNYPEVRIVRLERNLGFAGGTNLGIRSSASDYVATLNNDTQAEPAWLEELVEAMESHPRVGMVASKMLFHDQREVINSAGIAVDRAGMAWDLQGGVPDHGEGQPYDVFGPCAGAALYRRAMLAQIGPFDEDYFSYLEDVDLAWRARATGWRCLYMPSARVYHVHSGSGLETTPLKSYLLGRNKWWTIIKNYPWPQLATHAPLILSYDLMALMYTLVVAKTAHGLRGRLAALQALPAARRKRHAVCRLPGYSPRLAFECLHPPDAPVRTWQRYRHLPAGSAPAEPRL